jgi:hypothetical protein
LKEYHRDAKGSTYGNLLIRIGEGDYIGGDTFMDHGRACFSMKGAHRAVGNEPARHRRRHPFAALSYGRCSRWVLLV